MSKKIISVTSKGVRESVSGDSRALPTSAELKLETSKVESLLSVSSLQTGTLSSHSAVLAGTPSVVILPSEPTLGQRVTVLVGGGQAMGISSSAYPINDTTVYAIKLTPSSGQNGAVRDFFFIQVAGEDLWLTPGSGSVVGTTGSYTF